MPSPPESRLARFPEVSPLVNVDAAVFARVEPKVEPSVEPKREPPTPVPRLAKVEPRAAPPSKVLAPVNAPAPVVRPERLLPAVKPERLLPPFKPESVLLAPASAPATVPPTPPAVNAPEVNKPAVLAALGVPAPIAKSVAVNPAISAAVKGA